MSPQCRSISCKQCNQRHHTLLHNNNVNSNTTSNSQGNQGPHHNSNVLSNRSNSFNKYLKTQSLPEQGDDKTNSQINTIPSGSQELIQHNTQGMSLTSNTLSALSIKNVHVLLATACVTIYNSQGVPITAKVLLDSASQSSFISENLVKKLNFNPYCKTLNISGISGSTIISDRMINLVMHSNVYENKNFRISCSILPRITCMLPQVNINTSKFNIPDKIILANPFFYKPS